MKTEEEKRIIEGRTIQSSLRIGKYIIYQIPMNIVLTSVGLSEKTLEEIILNKKSYHGSYEQALGVLVDRMVEDNMSKSTVDAVKNLRDSIREAKEEIIKEVRLQKYKLK